MQIVSSVRVPWQLEFSSFTEGGSEFVGVLLSLHQFLAEATWLKAAEDTKDYQMRAHFPPATLTSYPGLLFLI